MPKLSHYTPYIGTVNCILVDANRRIKRASQVALVVNNLPANAGDTRDMGLIPELGRYPGGGHENPSSILAWRIPWTEEPGRLQSIVSKTFGQDLSN